MKKYEEKLLSLLMIMAIIAGVVFQPVYGSMTAEAKTPFMKTLGLKWDLKEGKWVTIRTNYVGNIWLESKATIKNVKLKNAKKKGYKKLSYTINIKYGKPTSDQIHKTCAAYTNNGGEDCDYEFSAFCYDIDGFDMIEDSDSDIKASGKWTFGKKHKYKDFDGCSWKLPETAKCKFTIVYPAKDYKKICIGIAGNGSYKHPSGTGFNVWERPVYKKDKKNIHFMLVG